MELSPLDHEIVEIDGRIYEHKVARLKAENDTVLLNLLRSSKADSERAQAIIDMAKGRGLTAEEEQELDDIFASRAQKYDRIDEITEARRHEQD
jgi:shikimate kinase